MTDIPPPPPGFIPYTAAASGDIPPPPPGFVPAASLNSQSDQTGTQGRDIPTIDPFPLVPTTKAQLDNTATTAKGIYKGAIEDPVLGTSQLLAHGATYAADLGGYAPNAVSRVLGQSRDSLDAAMAQREQAYQAERAVSGLADTPDVARFIGMVGSPSNFLTANAAAPAANFLRQRLGNNLLSRGTAAAGTGAAIAAEQPVYGGNYADEKLNQAEGGALAGGLLEAGVSSLAPWINARAQRLANAGVPTTLGQNLGPWASRVEEGTQSIPGSGMVVRSARERANEGLNRVVADEVLAPIGQQANPNTEPGRNLMREVNDHVNQAYNQVLPHLQGQIDPQFQAEIARIRTRVPAPVQADFDDAIQRHILDRADQNGTIAGRANKEADIDLRDDAIGHQRGNQYEVRLGRALGDAREAMRNMWDRYNPQDLTEGVRNADASYGLARIMERASSSVGAPDGIFNAAHLQSAVKAQDITGGKRAFTEGGARLSHLADDAKAVMGSKLNDSGTPERAALMSVLQHGGNVATGLGALAGVISPTQLGGLLAHALAYTPQAQNGLRWLANGSPQMRNALANGVRAASPAGVNALAPQIPAR